MGREEHGTEPEPDMQTYNGTAPERIYQTRGTQVLNDICFKCQLSFTFHSKLSWLVYFGSRPDVVSLYILLLDGQVAIFGSLRSTMRHSPLPLSLSLRACACVWGRKREGVRVYACTCTRRSRGSGATHGSREYICHLQISIHAAYCNVRARTRADVLWPGSGAVCEALPVYKHPSACGTRPRPGICGHVAQIIVMDSAGDVPPPPAARHVTSLIPPPRLYEAHHLGLLSPPGCAAYHRT